MNIHAPKEIQDLLDEFVADFRKLLKDNLAGIYLHGSLAMNCFNPETSDIDIFVVSRDKVPVTLRKAMADIMLKLTPKAPPKGIEMSVVTLHEKPTSSPQSEKEASGRSTMQPVCRSALLSRL